MPETNTSDFLNLAVSVSANLDYVDCYLINVKYVRTKRSVLINEYIIDYFDYTSVERYRGRLFAFANF